MKSDHHAESSLFEVLLQLENVDEVKRFLKDLCTPQEIKALQERWRVCQILALKDFSYREISKETGASLTTIGRVARFLKDEPNKGYQRILTRMQKKKTGS